MVSKTLCAYKLKPNSIKIDILNRDVKIKHYLVTTCLKIININQYFNIFIILKTSFIFSILKAIII
ncbi:hypothetical protein EXD98_17760 [Acinetobacter pittii]|uniref:Uncharacterized protein n=1 Tax=Acinetobacter pittii TaxID=48296 RepID=A0AAE8G8X9_ACIPI|nr:hypothetical protein DKP84_19325 [Acinetobacter pittii]RZH26004.1 hypothetical protein EXD98_17760 [Acinetobacter pittii]